MRNIRITLAYEGTAYSGFQRQENSITVQEILETALQKLTGTKTTLYFVARTDAGVHARLMVAHFDWVETLPDPAFLADKLNRLLPKDIVIYRIVPVIPEAHARFDATSRTYQYYLTMQKDPFRYDLVYRYLGKLDFDRMNEACRVLFDYVDFTSFSKLHTDVKTNNCRIYEAGWKQEGDLWVFTIRADRFLRNMVRAIVGTLLEVGRGKMSVDGFRRVIEAKDRGKAGTSAPGHALFLVNVTYPDRLFEV